MSNTEIFLDGMVIGVYVLGVIIALCVVVPIVVVVVQAKRDKTDVDRWIERRKKG